jgi:hypothetical protein
MRWTKNLFRHFGVFSRFEIFHCEIEAEINFHLEMRTQENIELGMLPEAARQDALQRFGDLEDLKRLCKQARQENRVAKRGQALKAVSLLLATSGLVISCMDAMQEIHQVGHLFVVIAILLRLFLYAKRAYLKSDHPSFTLRETRLSDRDDS